MKFKVGDRIVSTKILGTLPIGSKGIIIKIKPRLQTYHPYECHFDGVRYAEYPLGVGFHGADYDDIRLDTLEYIKRYKQHNTKGKDIMKKFFLTTDGQVAPHKPNKKEVVGFGLLFEDQQLTVTTVGGKTFNYNYSDVKVSGHLPRLLVALPEGDKVSRVFIMPKLTSTSLGAMAAVVNASPTELSTFHAIPGKL